MRWFGTFNKLPREAVLLGIIEERPEEMVRGTLDFACQAISHISAQKRPSPLPIKQELAWMGCSNLNIICVFFQLATASCIFLALFSPLVVVVLRPEAYVAKSARRESFSQLMFSEMPFTNCQSVPLETEILSVMIQQVQDRVSLSSIRLQLESCWHWCHSSFGLLPPFWDAQQAHEVSFRLYFSVPHEQQPLGVLWRGCDWSMAGEA